MKEIPIHAIKELDRARNALLAAKLLLKEGLYNDCVSRSYYAVLHSAKTALHINGIESRTHEGVRKMFGLHLIKSGKIESEFAEIFITEQEDRKIGDYEVEINIDEETARQRVDEAEKFVKRIEKYIQELT